MEKRLLVLDDEPLIAWGIAAEMEDCGWSTVVVGTSAEALEAIASGGIDAAVLDFNLRGETAEDVARAVIARGIPFVFVSGAIPESFPNFRIPVSVLTKPIDYRKVHSTLVEKLGERPSTPVPGAAALG